MSPEPVDRSTSARLAQASERLNILARELDIAVTEAARSGPDLDLLSWLSTHLGEQALDLTEITFAVAEDVVAASEDARAERSAAALGRISRIIEPVFEVAIELAAHLVILVHKAAREGAPLTSERLTTLDDPIAALLSDEPLVTGAGVAMAPHSLTDRDLWMQWWVRSDEGPVQLFPQLDPRASHYYDYPSAVWFSPSARDLAPHLAPPHFDSGGTDSWMVTATVPVVVRDDFVGLACAELTLEHIGVLSTPALEAMPAPTALVAPEGLVVASTHPDLRPGESVSEARWRPARETTAPFVEVGQGLTLARSPVLPWVLLTEWP